MWWRRQRHGSRGATRNGVHALSRNIVAGRGIPSWEVRHGAQMTAYRQQALVVANALASTPSRPRDLRILAPDAAKIVQATSMVGSSGSSVDFAG